MIRIVTVFLSVFLLSHIPAPVWAAEKEHGSSESEEGDSSGPVFVTVGPINVPVLDNQKIVQYLMLTAALQVEDDAAAKQVAAYMPLLRDAYLSSLYGALHAVGVEKGLVDMNLIRSRLEEANKRVLPDGLVKNVLLQQVEQRLR